MSRLRKLAMCLTILFIFAVPQTGLALGKRQSARAAHSKAGARTATFPPLWSSETTHNLYRVRIEGNILRADQVNVPPKAAKQGAYVRTEVRQTVDKWIGTTKSYMQLTGGQVSQRTTITFSSKSTAGQTQLTKERATQSQPSNWCHLVTNTEILTLSPQRITGRAEALQQVDIPKCRVLKKEWKDFIWVPAK